MKKLLLYQTAENADLFYHLLCSSLLQNATGFNLHVANVTTHGLARVFERGVMENQKALLYQMANNNKVINFNSKEVSEIRGVKTANSFVITGLVLNDIVFAVHSRNMTPDLIKLGFGTSEGAGYGVIKTALVKPNKPQDFVLIDGWTISKNLN
jgi:hypothetical protein